MSVIDLTEYSRPDKWDDNPLARRVAYVLHKASLTRRWRIAKEANDYAALDRLDREWNVLECY